jgi:hypothetical protein
MKAPLLLSVEHASCHHHAHPDSSQLKMLLAGKFLCLHNIFQQVKNVTTSGLLIPARRPMPVASGARMLISG